jgi:hypothetical protein
LEIGSCELFFGGAAFKPHSSWSLPPEKLGLQAWATGARLVLGFELRALKLVVRGSSTWATPIVFLVFAWVIFGIVSEAVLEWLSDPPTYDPRVAGIIDVHQSRPTYLLR